MWRRLARLAAAYGDQPIRMSQVELAQGAGTIRETASRVLQAGVRDGLLALERGAIHVIDRAAVARRAGL